MTVVPHIRMTAYGDLPGGEIFNFGLALANPDDANGGFGEGLFFSGNLVPGGAVWDDLSTDLQTFWNSAGVWSGCKLRGVKFAAIGSDGKYREPVIERVIGGTTGLAGGNSLSQPANQVTMAVTTHSAGDLGRVKGRFYLPMPGYQMGTDGRISEANRDTIETAAKTWIDNINNEPGLDLLNLHAVIASSGRHNPDGSVKLAPKNWKINAVSVGRVPDTQRRRRNKLTEFRGTASTIA